MGKFPPASPWIKDLFASLVTPLECERRAMFGYPCAFVNGQMFAGVFGDGIIVRLGEKERAALLAVEGAAVFDPMGGRPMREYVRFPDDMLEDEADLAAWVGKGFAYARSLPPKQKRPPKARTPGKTKAAATRARKR